jgi:hypothetical protein
MALKHRQRAVQGVVHCHLQGIFIGGWKFGVRHESKTGVMLQHWMRIQNALLRLAYPNSMPLFDDYFQ